jgi:hydrogenase maturation protease
VKTHTLLIGYGNPVRRDDGLGLEIAGQVEKECPPGVEVRTSQQLHIELLEDLQSFDRVVLVDASTDGPEILFEQVGPLQASGLASSHHLDPALLMALAKKLGRLTPPIYLCAVRGDDFEMGEHLTPTAQRRARLAAQKILDFLDAERGAYA